MAKNDETSVRAEWDQIKAAYDEAMDGYRGVTPPEPRKKRQAQRAMDDVFEFRRELRLIGQYVGDRDSGTDATRAAGIPDEKVMGIKTVDNTDEVPAL